MKHAIKKLVCFVLFLCFLPLYSLAGSGMVLRFDRKEHWVDGSRHVVYAQLVAQDPAFSAVVEKVNQAIQETASIQDYVNLLPTVQADGTGLLVHDSLAIASSSLYLEGEGYFYVLMEAEGKMPKGRPSHHYYPMLFDMASGERVSFDQLFTDPEGAKAYIENYLLEVVEPRLSSYMENNQLFPVPYENFGFSEDGHIVIYYPSDQLSFLSGTSGAVAFRYSELWEYLDTSESGIALQMVKTGRYVQQYTENRAPDELRNVIQEYLRALPGLDHVSPSLGTSMEHMKENYPITTDSGYYPGGAYFETETPELLGTYLITDPNESYLSGILTSRIDMYGIETGKTTLAKAKELLGAPTAELPLDETAAGMYLVCPGTLSIYSFIHDFPIQKGETGQDSSSVSLALYADTAGVVQYISLSLN
ncbi:MAG: hypothetical protein E7329_05045 [Clostridiales bacterium]|nr:hypothetical protein [Clostridiales bacterium]